MDILKSYKLLEDIKKEIDLFNDNKSQIIQLGDRCHYLDGVVYFHDHGNEMINKHSLAHELAHYYQDLYNIEYNIPDNYKSFPPLDKMYLDIEFQANIVATRYLYFIEGMDYLAIEQLNQQKKIFPCHYFHSCIKYLEVEEHSESPLISISFTPKTNENKSNNILFLFRNEMGEDIAHLGQRNYTNLWFAFHNGEKWLDFIAQDSMSGKVIFNICKNRDSINKMISSHYEENKDYLYKIDKVLINHEFVSEVSFSGDIKCQFE